VKIKVVARMTLVGLLTHGAGVCAKAADARRSAGADDRKPLELRINAAVGMAPATLRGLAIVTSDPTNRLLRVSIDGENLFQSSDIALEGTGAPRSHFLSWRDLPAGHYVVTVVLYSGTGPRATVIREFIVIGN
jgi:hypothetical protein